MPSPFFAPGRARSPMPGHRRLINLALLGAALVLPPVAGAAEQPLTLADAQRLAVKRSLALPAQDAAIAASRGMAVAAGQLPDPVLKAGIDNLPVNGAGRFSLADDFMTMRRLGVSQELTRAGKRQLRAERYVREADKSLAEKDRVTAAIERDTALAWLERYYAQYSAAMIAEQAELTTLEVQAAQAAYRAGRGTQADLLAARSAAGSVQDRAIDARRRADAAKTMLARWIGEAAALPLAARPDIGALRLGRDALALDLAHHPAIAVLDKQQDIAATEAMLAQADRTADWSVEVAFQQRGPVYSNMISVGVSVPLQWDRKNRQDREVAAKLALLEQARAERIEALRTRIADTGAMLDEWQSDRQRHDRYESELIPLARERTAAVMAAYRGGKSGLADVLAARRGEIEVRLQALRLEADTARLWAQLTFLFPTARTPALTTKESR